jgi:hypothetical protein
VEPQKPTDREPEREVERRDGRTDPNRPFPLTHSETTIQPFDRRYFELYGGTACGMLLFWILSRCVHVFLFLKLFTDDAPAKVRWALRFACL